MTHAAHLLEFHKVAACCRKPQSHAKISD